MQVVCMNKDLQTKKDKVCEVLCMYSFLLHRFTCSQKGTHQPNPQQTTAHHYQIKNAIF